MRPMKSILASLAILALALPLTACNNEAMGVRISTEKKKAAPAAVVLKPRSEPIFYNGKTYHLDFAPGTVCAVDMAVGVPVIVNGLIEDEFQVTGAQL